MSSLSLEDAKKLAEELGVDIDKANTSGNNDSVTRKDLLDLLQESYLEEFHNEM